MDERDALRLRYRIAPLEMTPSEFRKAGRQLVERLAEYLCTLPERPVIPPASSQTARDLLEEAADLLFAHSTTSGHPRFLGGIPSAAAPIGALGDLPFLVVGSAGTMSTGAVDPLPALAAICREDDLWLHVDGTYGGFAALLLHEQQGVEVPADLEGIGLADSVAVAPHTWLYAPLEVGCILVRDRQALRETFGSHSHSLYDTKEAMAAMRGKDDHKDRRSSPGGRRAGISWEGYPLRVSYLPSGFSALKVWLALRQVGRAGYVEMIADDLWLAQELYRLVEAHPELQAFSQGLSITTFRYVPPGLIPGSQEVEAYLTSLNTELLHRLQRSGEAFLSHAVVKGVFLLRACVVNFRTSCWSLRISTR
jgi:glutamate/tyrosine decarboxylase-like PLP-dependent enzyme